VSVSAGFRVRGEEGGGGTGLRGGGRDGFNARQHERSCHPSG